MTDLLKILENDARLSPETIALMLDEEVGDIKKMIDEYEREGVILGYRTPQRDRGYDHVAQKIYNYPEVESLFLMSGSFDLAVFIKGKTMREVAFFVAEKLATIADVISTSTHFVLRKYKDNNIVYGSVPVDERGNEF